MAIFKCKMCGGTIEFEQGATVGICDSCGTKQSLPAGLDDEKRANLYDRANHFRRNNEYDKAMAIYEKILEEDGKDAEAYWSIVLCRYGIEYVEDPTTHKRVPTINRAQFSSVVSDKDYKSALKYGDVNQKEIYKAEARAIDKIQKGILEISSKEEPFDVFICYKETDANGRRTPDSVLANELYHQLTQEGFKVFFSRITLEDKLGQEYEPYIFAALNSAKVMVVLGTKPEFFNAVWVRNEWSRYLSLIKNGEDKTLVPAYKDMDPYDLPEEFSHLQAQDMSKLGFMQDLIRGIKKIVGTVEPVVVEQRKETVVVNNAVNISPLLKRAFMFLEDGDFERADEFCEQVLNQDPECAKAYLGKLMAELRVNKREQLADCVEPFDINNNYQKAIKFGNQELVSTLEAIRNQFLYNKAVELMSVADSECKYKEASKKFEEIISYKDASNLSKECLDKAEQLKQKRLAKEEADRLEAERKAEEKRIADEKAAKKRKKIIAITTPIVCACIAFFIVLTTVIIPTNNRKSAYEKYGTVFSNANVGDIIRFGAYEQDYNTSNGKEEIEWRVLAKEKNRILVISEYGLDCQPYNTEWEDVTWETCSLRKWMNSTFLNNAFSAAERSIIQSTNVSADKNPIYSTNPGNATKDKVFLLSITEAEKYFTSDEDRKCVPTAYAIAQGAWTSGSYTKGGAATCWWWLRSPGFSQNIAAGVCGGGSVDYNGSNAYFGNSCVRPALWISFE